MDNRQLIVIVAALIALVIIVWFMKARRARFSVARGLFKADIQGGSGSASGQQPAASEAAGGIATGKITARTDVSASTEGAQRIETGDIEAGGSVNLVAQGPSSPKVQ